MRPEVEILIPKQKYFSDIDEKPVQTRAGRQVRKPERYGTKISKLNNGGGGVPKIRKKTVTPHICHVLTGCPPLS